MKPDMKNMNKTLLGIIMLALSLCFANAQAEPRATAGNGQRLINNNNLNGWDRPSNRWSISNGVIRGTTNGQQLQDPEWLFSNSEYEDFIFTTEIRLIGNIANSGIYFRSQRINFSFQGRTYEAPSGYEFDIIENRDNFNASIGDFFGRGPSFRHRANRNLVNNIYVENGWNRFTVRAEGNRIEYWLNGTRVNALTDNDPNHQRRGVIGIQLHDRIIMQVQMRNAFVRNLSNNNNNNNNNNGNTVTLRKRNAAGFALDGQNGAANGQNVHLWNFNNNNGNQRFSQVGRGSNFFTYIKQGTDHCLDGGNGGGNGQNVVLWRVNANNFNQHWRRVSRGGGAFQLRKRNSQGFSIDGGNGGRRRQNVTLFSTNTNNQNQQWIIN